MILDAIRSPWSLLLSRLKSPSSLSLTSKGRCSSSLIIFEALLWTHSNSSMSFLCWGPQNWMQYSRWVPMGAEQRGRITSLYQLVMLLLMQLRIQLAFWAASIHYWLMLSLSSADTTKSFTSGLVSGHSMSNLYLCLGMPWPKFRTLHLSFPLVCQMYHSAWHRL